MGKVEEIRKKPEHIRMRYVWFFVAVSMLFVIIIWIFSLVTSQQNTRTDSTNSDPFNSDIFDQFGDQKKALDDTRKNIQDSLSAPKTTPLNPSQPAE